MYKEIWNAYSNETELPCKREIGDAHDPFAVLVKVLEDYLAE